MVLWKIQLMHCSESFLQDFGMHSLLPAGYGHGISIKVVDIILLPPGLHCIQAKCLGVHESVQNPWKKGMQTARVKCILVINISSLQCTFVVSKPLFFSFLSGSLIPPDPKCCSWLLVWFIFVGFPLLSFAPIQGAVL